ncbi:Chromatin remodeling complex subunit (Chd3), putative [Penicillium digitatum PHI26]|uniref:Chromatin remodeling complex subunit (Chd3), putative n=2 Tax=Penicillium digitatum TaxID=36651 RepID=K9FD29_PEND2|nr:Chromatin remodeling complex subunit (Chd3), putative [Penicillium digitatum Pd1]EKV07280.1 Chromatin remodeling complex subunit (Chd3), putative [Penicillium digitatum PHI26]EKV14358.1 Chromatin remodeling complex subunit (Chd3), putative [Penicillium digitatum Pd1]
MSQARDNSSTSDGPDAMAAQLLAQLQIASSRTTPAIAPTGSKNALQPEHQITGNSEESTVSFEIIVPVVNNPEDYEYLPGHFEVHHILAVDLHEPKLIMTIKKLKSLNNGREALREFNRESQSPDPLAMDYEPISHLIYSGGDGPGDYDSDMDWGIARRRQQRGPKISYSHFFHSGHDDEDENYQSRHEDYSVDIEDSEEPSDEDEYGPPTKRRHLRRGVQKGRKQRTDEWSEQSPPSDSGKRASHRLRKTRQRNLKERLEDDEFSQPVAEQPKKQKFSGAREHFRELPHDNEFRQCHSQSCTQCGYKDHDREKGSLVFCQGCTVSYHQGCLGDRSNRKHLVTKVDKGDFILQCSRCLGIKHQEHDMKPHLGHCAVCRDEGPMSQPLRETLSSQTEQQLREANNGVDPIAHVDLSRVNNVDNVLIRCLGGSHSCKRAFHIQHLPNTTERDRADIDPDHWQCNDCSESPPGINPIHAIVAWRPKNADVKVVPQLVEMTPEIDKEYLVKWNKMSYFRVTWLTGDWVWSMAPARQMKAFLKSDRSTDPIMTTAEAIPEENLRVDIIFDVEYHSEPRSQEDRANAEMVKRAYVKYKGLPYEDSVWEEPPSQTDTARWEDFRTALLDRVLREDTHPLRPKDLQSRLRNARKQEFDKSLILTAQPALVTGGELMEYQMDGVNWLLYMFFKQKNAILADDMGLGKTIQVITFFSALIEKLNCFPFLVVVPNATVPNWRREIKSWSPDVRVVTYYGSIFAREMTREHELFHKNGTLCCHVVIASYESMVDDGAKRVLSSVNWAGLVVDEGQRLKNDKSQLYERLLRMKFGFKLLLTGTPLQNNIRELFNLVQFIDPTHDAEKLEAQYGGVLDKEAIRELHDMIRPCLLRRTKAEVLPFLPPMVQIIIPISMSVLQKKLYKLILQKNPQLIKAICKKHTGQLKKAERHNLNNILMQLRKCLCHPFIYNRDIEEQTLDPQLSHRRLVEASGKLQLLNLMLPRLRERGHRVLIFSQFLENLNIIEDFLTGIGLQYRRLDGNLSSREKQQQIDQFNAPDSPFFAFLLSTRSGGVGINLATADTVIIMDPDFNPKQDMQALSRAHRIGQKNTVLVFHLVVRASVEEKIMQKGKTKMALDHVLIDRIEADEDKEDLESILKHGAQALFNDDNSADITYDTPSIDKLLDRSQAEQAKQVANEGSSNQNEQAQFNFARVWQKDQGSLEEVTETEDTPVDVTAWEKILQEREREALEEANRQTEGLGRGKRKRGAPRYDNIIDGVDDDENPSPTRQPPAKMRKAAADNDYEFKRPEEGDETETESERGLEPPHNGDDGIMSMGTAFDGDKTESYTGATQMGIAKDFAVSPSVYAEHQARMFRRVESPPPVASMGANGTQQASPPCVACQKHHITGRCPLRHAGVEFCGLCGLAHWGGRRACPHMQSSVQITRMLEALEKSTEAPPLISLAKRYLQGILKSVARTARDERKKAMLSAQAEPQAQLTSASTGGVSRANVTDLTEGSAES